MNKQCNIGNESKVPKQLFQFIVPRRRSQEEANSPK